MYQVKQLTGHVEGEILLFSFAEIIDLPHNNLPEDIHTEEGQGT